jgi:hypothetical protein
MICGYQIRHLGIMNIKRSAHSGLEKYLSPTGLSRILSSNRNSWNVERLATFCHGKQKIIGSTEEDWVDQTEPVVKLMAASTASLGDG